MKRLKFLLIALVSLFLLSSCGLTTNLTHNVNENQTSVVLSQANFHVVKTVSTKVSSTYFFGIGGLSKKALKNNAVAELTSKAKLTGSQALINVTVKSSVKTVLIWNQITYYAEATVIEFDK